MKCGNRQKIGGEELIKFRKVGSRVMYLLLAGNDTVAEVYAL